ncbi:MAG: metal ABC transporter substrate-binding protein [Treponema sp.]|jgi:zinc transport system substrate-binding protein|nr:metal ABC transporter substrate-binding protein [Treponema sp.]
MERHPPQKALFLAVVVCILLITLAACKPHKNAAVHDQNGKINVTVTNFPPYDFVRQIAGDRVNLSMLLPPGAESHSFEPSPRDIITIQNSAIFIYSGGGSDKWVDRILQSMNTGNMNILAVIDTVEAVDEEIVEGMEEDGDDDESDYDEHVWTSPRNAIRIVQAITETLCETDAANDGYYRQNAAAYIEKLRLLDIAFTEVVSGSKRGVIVFADRFPFRYLADAYGLTYYAAFPGCSTETEPSAATVKFLIDKIRAERIPVVFHIELSNERMANTISGETGAKKLLLHSSHNITKKDFDSGMGYLEIMKNNVENLREALF